VLVGDPALPDWKRLNGVTPRFGLRVRGRKNGLDSRADGRCAQILRSASRRPTRYSNSRSGGPACGSLLCMSESTSDSAPPPDPTPSQDVTRELGESLTGSGYFERSAQVVGLTPSDQYEPPTVAAFVKPAAEPSVEPSSE
jgi:hypothetical protein